MTLVRTEASVLQEASKEAVTIHVLPNRRFFGVGILRSLLLRASVQTRETTSQTTEASQSQCPHDTTMNEQPTPLAKPVLTQAILNTWDWPQIVQYLDLTTGLSSAIPPWKFAVMPKHDLARVHGIPK